jgi:hypothetical protein
VKMYIVLHEQKTATGDEKTEDGRIMQPWTAKPGHEVNENWRIAGPDQDLKGEVRIIAKRGRRVGAVQLGLGQNKTWKELKGKDAGGFMREGQYLIWRIRGKVTNKPADWKPYHNDMADAIGWIYGGYSRRMQLASVALNV